MRLSKSLKPIVISCALMLLLGVSPSWAQGNFGLNIAGGLSTPTSDFNDFANLGFGVHGSFYIEFSPIAAAGIGIGYNRFGFDEGSGDFEVDGGEPAILNICPEIRFMVGTGDMGTFAFILGGGWYRLMQSDLTVATPSGEFDPEGVTIQFEFDPLSEFGANVGGQALYPMSDTVKIGAEAKYHIIFTDEESTTFFDFMAVLAITTGT